MLWSDDSYKDLKMKAMEKDIEEKELRMELIRCQIEESRQRAQAEKDRSLFFSKAGLALNRSSEFQIRSTREGVILFIIT